MLIVDIDDRRFGRDFFSQLNLGESKKIILAHFEREIMQQHGSYFFKSIWF